MLRTRVGYTGGTTPNPTYRSIKDHTEAIQIDFDPKKVSYKQLLSLALKEGNFVGSEWSRQYRSAVFYHDEAQRKAAESLNIEQLEPAGIFTRAEDYHQKYYLQQSSLVQEFYQRYPDITSFTDSTAVTRANGIAGGHLNQEQLQAVVPQLGVSEDVAAKMYKLANSSKTGCAIPNL